MSSEVIKLFLDCCFAVQMKKDHRKCLCVPQPAAGREQPNPETSSPLNVLSSQNALCFPQQEENDGEPSFGERPGRRHNETSCFWFVCEFHLHETSKLHEAERTADRLNIYKCRATFATRLSLDKPAFMENGINCSEASLPSNHSSQLA